MLKYTLLFLLFVSSLSAQVFYRVECDVSIKEINADGQQQLMVGKVYFDKHIREVVYDIRFPHVTRFAITDYGMKNDSSAVEIDAVFLRHLVDFSVFNLILNGKLTYFGLSDTQYTMVSATKDEDMVISEWVLPEEMTSDYGKMLISQKDNLLYGMVSMDAQGEVVSKQFFTDYTQVRDLSFPCRLIQMNFKDGKSVNKKITTFSNVVLNNPDRAHYHFH